ncbi:MAG: hypothetical protein U0800_19760 [Isosphaeraceae bacterium]
MKTSAALISTRTIAIPWTTLGSARRQDLHFDGLDAGLASREGDQVDGPGDGVEGGGSSSPRIG